MHAQAHTWAHFIDCVCVVRDQHGFSPLHYACMHGHGNIVDLFVHRGARTDTLNMGGDSLIHVAAQFGKYDVIMKVRVYLER